ncbi:3-polyprenyl-4-hydroxybenzoate decarboxylase-like decarboxylase [Anopheles sinensis]|uniref:3-polyprenyl-4-hydroxybenzoate decarboxylase-like decarboxylase n=1 Tax=Anopheles sinensis TaxID=74873 RepID=A0A084VE47_ANOSI|nr:3-polyprenyl-4-hydroxybenzoate decarboxylase-like decarboxylase [Anopheles sinensis]
MLAACWSTAVENATMERRGKCAPFLLARKGPSSSSKVPGNGVIRTDKSFATAVIQLVAVVVVTVVMGVIAGGQGGNKGNGKHHIMPRQIGEGFRLTKPSTVKDGTFAGAAVSCRWLLFWLDYFTIFPPNKAFLGCKGFFPLALVLVKEVFCLYYLLHSIASEPPQWLDLTRLFPFIVPPSHTKAFLW